MRRIRDATLDEVLAAAPDDLPTRRIVMELGPYAVVEVTGAELGQIWLCHERGEGNRRCPLHYPPGRDLHHGRLVELADEFGLQHGPMRSPSKYLELVQVLAAGRPFDDRPILWRSETARLPAGDWRVGDGRHRLGAAWTHVQSAPTFVLEVYASR